MLKKIKILVPLDDSDIPDATHKDAPDYRLVFEESMNLAEALNAEVVLLHIASLEDEMSIRPSHEPGSDRFYSPEDLKGLRETGYVAEIEDLIERHLPRLDLSAGAGAELKDWEEGRLHELELHDEPKDTLYALRAWAMPLTYKLQKPIQDLLARARDEGIQTRAMSMLDSQSLIICESAQEWDADLIVMGRGGASEWRSLYFDSVSTYVLHHTPCSVALVDWHLKEVQKIRKILVALDDSPTSLDIFLQAMNLAERIRAAKQSLSPNITDKDATPTLFLLHVTSPFEHGYSQMLTAFATWAEQRNIPVQPLQKPAPKVQEHFTESMLQPDALPGQVICEMATESGADLIVLGYRREWELKKLVLGSVCNYVTRHAPCSVFVVRAFKPLDIEPSSGKTELTHIEPAKDADQLFNRCIMNGYRLLMEGQLTGRRLQPVNDSAYVRMNPGLLYPTPLNPIGQDVSKTNWNEINFSGQNLIGQDFSGNNLNGRNFSNANLSKANLNGASLINADLSNANLEGANLSHANLSHANLSNANLVGAILIEATLDGVDLCHADLNRANLSLALFRDEPDLCNANFANANLTEAQFNGANLVGADFHGAILIAATMENSSNLDEANLCNANLHRAIFTNVTMRGADLRRADLSRATLNKVNLEDANFVDVKVDGAKFTNVSGLSMEIQKELEKQGV
ncbi:pentapeptide repeat-containing protein [Anabaena sp. UHCC 0451]|uniref:pentapeptide repeat-containing protein n=1 Tax=Anabaena sp. UHCC 0451 TaxID=2055235 RepID=UPI002B2218D3|nr:pentapeptide repeat-containing protein [Anabaena sp. UHCC 0451]MEA5575245.1 pentapeptide repeat-containing protein [Anabaena sp. UHCC 0451]